MLEVFSNPNDSVIPFPACLKISEFLEVSICLCVLLIHVFPTLLLDSCVPAMSEGEAVIPPLRLNSQFPVSGKDCDLKQRASVQLHCALVIVSNFD